MPASHSLATEHWPLATVLCPTFHQRGQVVRGLIPAGYCHPPTAELGKSERGPISTIALSLIQHVTESGDRFGQVKLFLPARRHPIDGHYRVLGGAGRHRGRAHPLLGVKQTSPLSPAGKTEAGASQERAGNKLSIRSSVGSGRTLGSARRCGTLARACSFATDRTLVPKSIEAKDP